MTTTSGEKPLELSVRNFGPIAEANIELRPLSVFVGPSNTGKSYLATLIYALHQFFGRFSEHSEYTHDSSRVTTSGWPLANSARHMELSAEEIEAVYIWAYEEPSLGRASRRLEGAHSDVPPDIIADLVRRVVSSGSGESQYWNDAVLRCFGVGKPDYLTRHQARKDVEFFVSGKFPDPNVDDEYFRFQTSLTSSGTMIDFSIAKTLPVLMNYGAIFPWLYLSSDDVALLKEDNARLFLGALASPVLSSAVGNVGRRAHYLPADRAGAVRSHSALTGTLIARASRPLAASHQPTLSGIYGDFLEGIVGLGGLPTRTAGPFDTLSDSMELNILDGEIWVDSNLAGYPSFFYRPKGWDQDIPLMNASSMVSELAPVVLYLRHVVQPGETLIIEEPESALHPAMQVELTRLLAAAVKAGIRIIITTHSEWILEELANLVLMSELPVEQRHGFEGADLALSPDEVGAWLFEPDESLDGGTVVREIPLDKEIGNFDSGFGLITTDLYNRYARISNRIERLKEG